VAESEAFDVDERQRFLDGCATVRPDDVDYWLVAFLTGTRPGETAGQVTAASGFRSQGEATDLSPSGRPEEPRPAPEVREGPPRNRPPFRGRRRVPFRQRLVGSSPTRPSRTHGFHPWPISSPIPVQAGARLCNLRMSEEPVVLAERCILLQRAAGIPGLENRQGASSRGFESHPLRFSRPWLTVVATAASGPGPRTGWFVRSNRQRRTVCRSRPGRRAERRPALENRPDSDSASRRGA